MEGLKLFIGLIFYTGYGRIRVKGSCPWEIVLNQAYYLNQFLGFQLEGASIPQID